MAFSRGPKIAKEGLVLCLDAANVKSFRGEPTVNYAVGVSPWTNGGVNTNITGTYEDDGPVTNSNTWKFEKTGGSYQWNGWESNYGGIWTGNAGDYWTTSYWYKTNSPAGMTGFGVGSFYKSDWSAPYNVTIIGGDSSIIADGEWHYNYTTSQINENYSNAIIVDGPSWGYNNIPGTLYINGLQWEKKPYPTAYSNGTRGTTVTAGGGVKDLTNFNNNGELINGPIYNSLNNGSLVFDGIDDCIDIPNSTILGINDSISIELFVKINSNNLGSVKVIANKYSGVGWEILLSSDGKLQLGGRNGDGTYYVSNSNVIIADNKFHHVVVVKSGLYWMTYIDGLLKSTITASSIGTLSNNTTLQIGREGSGYYTNMHLCVFKIYSRVLTPEEILQNYNAIKGRFE